jgi:hypothetical protein
VRPQSRIQLRPMSKPPLRTCSPSTSALVNTDGACSRAPASSSPSKAYSMALEAVMTARPRPPNCSPIPMPVPARAVMPRSNAPA